MLSNIDKELLPIIESFNGMQMDITKANLAKYRKLLNNNQPTDDIVGVEVYLHSFTQAKTDIKVKIYKPKNVQTLKPALLWMHGGGYILGSVENDPIAIEIANAMNIVVISVDYSLAPEQPFPAAHNDCYLALHWLIEQAENLGVDSNKIAVGGDSAGAGLAACLIQRCVFEKGPKICFQLLLYPMLDNEHNTPSGLINDYPVWNRETSLNAWEMYLGQKKYIPPFAVAAKMEDLSNHPPTYITVGEVDLFRDECIDYAQRLMHAGVTTELAVFPGMIHGGQFLVPTASVSQRMKNSYLKALSDALLG